MNPLSILKRKPADQIVDSVCSIFQITRAELFGEVRKRNLVDARIIVTHILWHQSPFRMTLQEIGKIFEKDHTTIIHYLKTSHRCDIYNGPLYDKLRICYLYIYGDDNVPFNYKNNPEWIDEIKKGLVETSPEIKK